VRVGDALILLVLLLIVSCTPPPAPEPRIVLVPAKPIVEVQTQTKTVVRVEKIPVPAPPIDPAKLTCPADPPLPTTPTIVGLLSYDVALQTVADQCRANLTALGSAQ